MNEPTFDRDGYPTEETLERIRTWTSPRLKGMVACMDFAGSAWAYPEAWVKDDMAVDEERPKGWPVITFIRYTFSTGGWSGNESIVAAIEANQMVQLVGAYSWRRGGHYEYRFPKDLSDT